MWAHLPIRQQKSDDAMLKKSATGLLMLGSLFAACSTDTVATSNHAPTDSTTDTDAGTPTDSKLPTGVSELEIGPEGGVVTSMDGLFSVQVPPEALAEPTRVQVSLRDPAPAGAETTAYEVEPDGLELAKPALLTFELPKAIFRAGLVVASHADGEWTPSGAPVLGESTTSIAGLTEHFSLWSTVRYACAADTQCPEGMRCLEDGFCGIPCRGEAIQYQGDCPGPLNCVEVGDSVSACVFERCTVHGDGCNSDTCVTWGNQVGVCAEACTTLERFSETATCGDPVAKTVCSGPRGTCTYRRCAATADCPSDTTCVWGHCLPDDIGCDCGQDGCPCLEAQCGNGIVEEPEQCEAELPLTETCESLGYGTGDLACTPSCTFDTSSCGTCGDGVVQTGEECDGSDLAGETCASLDPAKPDGTVACGPNCMFDTSGCSGIGDFVGSWSFALTAGTCDSNVLNQPSGDMTLDVSADGDITVNVSGSNIIAQTIPADGVRSQIEPDGALVVQVDARGGCQLEFDSGSVVDAGLLAQVRLVSGSLDEADSSWSCSDVCVDGGVELQSAP